MRSTLDGIRENDCNLNIPRYVEPVIEEETITVVSNQDAGAVNQLGIGTTKLSASGVDVAGTIAGITATGSGQVLKGAENSHVAGLELEVTTKTPLSTEVHYSKGISTSVFEQLDNLTKASTGLFDTRERSYTRQITDLDDRVDVLNQRLDTEEAAMRKKFTALETKISALQTQGNFLLSQLSSLIAT
ncbi:MAG: flagellar hook-associated protein FliD [candidate division BRC1 bacterium ADurb.BinA292]|nr:MAG: flagellar hook-associated protein FliD [candidate division BRC1 bacterium ADurb.BinA292]